MSLGPQRGVALIVCWLLLFVYLYEWFGSRILQSIDCIYNRLPTGCKLFLPYVAGYPSGLWDRVSNCHSMKS